MSKTYEMDYEVCKCRHVSLGELVHAIKNKNAKTIEDIQAITDAGTACGSCLRKEDDIGEEKLGLYIEDVLKKFINE